ncbi:phosphate ABC transporter substrate-binding protein, PhoT family [Halopseudomonas litoralis]|uniref:Phosphate-binding protein PstS n=1 Tax=Halopseudomonas litoralis TaxID=797277 RepID=A0A1H1Q4N5_9GAMM|nr:substrate-binding domain-containing protein [Halopseudomonas litoralis]SDS18462.1 phosphate ABC transporter substrate-binding protein, PhoT family [Halopseudomonas litoralis]
MTKFRMSALSALVAVGVMGMAGAASADGVVGGGATLPEDLYNGPNNTDGILTGSVPDFEFYTGVGSGAGKRAFFNNDATEFDLAAGTTVDYAGSDSLVTATEAEDYADHLTLGEASFGPLIQVPSVLTSVTVPFNVPGLGTLDLTSEQLALIFADPAVVNWNDSGLAIPNAPATPITVVYRTDGSGTTEIFLRHLNAINPALVSQVSNSFSGTIDVSSPKYVGANGSDGVVTALGENDYSITYVSPDKVDYDNPAEVASINGDLPTEVNVQSALTGILPPILSARNDAVNWGIGYVASGVSPIANPAQGYPIVGATNLIFSQCYLDGADSNKIRTFFDQHYASGSTVNDAAITAGSFIKLPENWRSAVYNAFYTQSSALSVGNANVCNGKGRPL